MTPGSIIALRKALRSALLAHSALVARLGGPRCYDEAPQGAQPPYITLGDVRSRDWSTASDDGAEHVVALDIWSRHHGVEEALDIAELTSQALAAMPAMTGHRLVSMRLQSSETRRENKGQIARTRLQFRAVTETI